MSIWKRIDNSSAGYSGECVYAWNEATEEGADYLLFVGERATRDNWLMDYWANFCFQEDQDPEIWNEIFDILRSHFGRLQTEACYSEVNIEVAEDFLKWLCRQLPCALVEIDTGIDEPWEISYILSPHDVEDSWWTVHRGSLVPTELVLVVETTEGPSPSQGGDNYVCK